MYEEQFGTDWETLDSDEALRRMFALGVAAAVDDPLPEERQRIVEEADTAYDRNVFDLSYREGKRKALGVEAASEADEIWNEVLDEEFEDRGTDAPDNDAASPSGAPEAIERASFLDRDTDELERLRLPELLGHRK